jgi:hypothetical protein
MKAGLQLGDNIHFEMGIIITIEMIINSEKWTLANS